MHDRRQFLKRFLAGAIAAPFAAEALLAQLMAVDTALPPVAQVAGPGLLQWAGLLGEPGQVVELARLAGPCELVQLMTSIDRPDRVGGRKTAGFTIRRGNACIWTLLGEDGAFGWLPCEDIRVRAGDVLLVEGTAHAAGQWCAGQLHFRGFVGDHAGAIALERPRV